MNNDKQIQLYKDIFAQTKARWDKIAKPIDSLGVLEEHVCKLCAIAGDVAPYNLDRRALVVMCADHGVVCEGVTQTGSEVTRVVAENFAANHSSVNYMSNVAGVDVFAVDIGMQGETYKEKQITLGKVIDRKIDTGTRNLVVEPAMTQEQCEQAINIGKEFVRELKQKGYKIILTGEMGIGNTTPSSVLAALLLEQSPDMVTGRGAGLDDQGLAIKKQVVARAVARVKDAQITDSKQILAEVGGYEIAGMVGMYLAGVEEQIPIVIDGAISAVAALVATAIDDRVPMYAFASHVSEEPIGKLVQQVLGLPAIIHGRLCLGEGSGAVALLPLLDMGLSVYRNMGTFDDLQIEAYDRSGKPLE